MTPFELTWEAPEYEFRPKDISWYWISIIIAVVMIGFSAWQKNFLFGLFILIAEILILAWANRAPLQITFMLNEKGLSIGGSKSYAYAEMESWSVDDFGATEWPALFFQFHKRLKPPIKIRIPRARMEEIKNVLKGALPQVKHEHSMIDTLEEFIGF